MRPYVKLLLSLVNYKKNTIISLCLCVKRNGSPYAIGPLSVCLSCLSVTFVHCDQTVGPIKMKLGTQVGLGPGHIVLDGDPAPPPPKGRATTQFSALICCGLMAGWIKMPLGMELGLSPGDFVLDGDPALPSPTRGQSLPLQFSAHFYCGQTAGCIKMSLGMEVGLRPGDFVLDGDPARLNFWAHVYYSYCDFVRTLHSRYWFVQVQVLVLYAFYF